MVSPKAIPKDEVANPIMVLLGPPISKEDEAMDDKPVPPLITDKAFVRVRVSARNVVANRAVDVALVVVAFTPVKFWRVVEAEAIRPPVKYDRPETEMAVVEAYGKVLAMVLVAVKYSPTTWPTTESLA